MTIIDNEMLWRQFGAAIDMLSDCLRDCPDELWEKSLWDDQPDQWVAAGFAAFWYLSYHTLFWLDLYLTGAEEGFVLSHSEAGRPRWQIPSPGPDFPCVGIARARRPAPPDAPVSTWCVLDSCLLCGLLF